MSADSLDGYYKNYVVRRRLPDKLGHISTCVMQALSEQIAREYVAAELNEWDVLKPDVYECLEFETYEQALNEATRDSIVVASTYVPETKKILN